MNNKILITSPSLNPEINISGISSVTQLIINSNPQNEYINFELGKSDAGRRNFLWLLRIFKTYFEWFFLMFSKRYTLIHFNLALDKRALLRDSPLILMARLFSRRMVIHIHGGEALTNPNNPRWVIRLLKLNFSGRNPKIVLSKQEQATLQNLLNINHVFVLPNCVEVSEAQNFNRESSGNHQLTLLFMGRIVLTKGIAYLFDALQVLKLKGVAFRFIMAGKGPDEALYVQKFKDLLGSDFEFKGIVYGGSKSSLLKECDIFLLPSFFEGLPVSLLEAMSFALVPVTTSVGSIKYLVEDGHNGLFVDKFSSNDIVAAIEKLNADRAYLETLSHNAQSFILANYSPAVYVSELKKIYNYE